MRQFTCGMGNLTALYMRLESMNPMTAHVCLTDYDYE